MASKPEIEVPDLRVAQVLDAVDLTLTDYEVAVLESAYSPRLPTAF
jgi:hypothetical protein